MPSLPLLVILLGPTASGKSALALSLAERFGGEIVSCDSVAVYRGMDIGTAKASPAERARVPHHLLDVAAPDQPYSAGDYSRDARAAIAGITARGRLPIVSGGTGLYLRALVDGLFAGPRRSEALRARLRASAARHDSNRSSGSGSRSNSWLHRLLQRLDPASAARIHPNDQPKLVRALEVSIATRQPLSAALGGAEGGRNPLMGYRIVRLGLQPDRAALYARIDRRAAAMFGAVAMFTDGPTGGPMGESWGGLLQETRALLDRYQPAPAALDALGYRQAVRVLRGELTLAEAIAEAQQGHRNYAKRQLTWFRREPEVEWLTGFGNEGAIYAAARDAVASALP